MGDASSARSTEGEVIIIIIIIMDLSSFVLPWPHFGKEKL
jgi:hypothetical protein